MTESEAIEKLKQHFEYLKHDWKPHPDYETMDAIGYAIQALEKQEKLRKYEDLDEQGLLLRLPCKVGDTVYRVNTGAKEPVIKMRVLQVHYKQLHKDRIIIRIDTINDNDMGESCYLLEDFGKSVFLTKAEAEQKLKEMENR